MDHLYLKFVCFHNISIFDFILIRFDIVCIFLFIRFFKHFIFLSQNSLLNLIWFSSVFIFLLSWGIIFLHRIFHWDFRLDLLFTEQVIVGRRNKNYKKKSPSGFCLFNGLFYNYLVSYSKKFEGNVIYGYLLRERYFSCSVFSLIRFSILKVER